MKLSKKILLALAILVSCVFAATVSFANTNATTSNNNIGEGLVNGARSVVGGAENAIEDVGAGLMKGVRDMTNGSDNTGDNMNATSHNTTGTNNAAGSTNNNSANTGMNNNQDNNDYTATRTATGRTADTDYVATRTNTDGTWLGMNSTAWIWLIMGIIAVAIVTLVWSYGSERRADYHSNND